MTLLRLGICSELSADVLEKLRQSGVKTVVQFIESDLDSLSNKSSVAYRTLAIVRRTLVSKYAAKSIDGATLFERQLSGLAIFGTGCSEIDALLDGGIYGGEVTEIWGQAAVGKTQFCFCIAANLLLETQRTLVYVDTRGGFSASRMLEILLHRGSSRENARAMLERIKHVTANDVRELISILECGKRWSDLFGPAVAVFIVDTIHSLLSPGLGGANADGMGLMAHVAQLLKALAYEKMLAAVVCNGAVRGKDLSEVKPALGHFWHHVPSVSLGIGLTESPVIANGCQLKGKQRIFTVSKSCRQPTGQETTCRLSSSGFVSK